MHKKQNVFRASERKARQDRALHPKPRQDWARMFRKNVRVERIGDRVATRFDVVEWEW